MICRFQNPEPEVGAQVPAQQQCQELRLPVTTEAWVSLGSKTLRSCCPSLQESYSETEGHSYTLASWTHNAINTGRRLVELKGIHLSALFVSSLLLHLVGW